MTSARFIYEDAPAFIPVPADLQHRKVEAILRVMDNQVATVAPGLAGKVRRRSPPTAFTGKVRELGDVMTSVPAADWGIDE
jgi:hypothetical protein